MTTQAEMMNKVRRKLYELKGNRITDEFLRDWINDACDDAATRTQCLRTSSTTPAVAGTQQYATPVDLLSIHAVDYKATSNTQVIPLEYRDYKNAASVAWGGLNSHPGAPALFWTWGAPPLLTVHLYPIPIEAGTLTYHYYKTFDKLAVDTSVDAATELPFPPGWDEMLVNFAVSEGLLSDRDNRHQIYRDRYEAKLTGLADTSIRFTDQGGVITNTNSWVPQHLWDWDF